MLVALSWENILKDTPHHSEKGNANSKHSEILPQPIQMAEKKNTVPSVGEDVKKL